MIDIKSYQSPFSWRYGSSEMRSIWSEEQKRLLWRTLWVAMAEKQTKWNLVTRQQVADLKVHVAEVDLIKTFEVEEKIQHDLMAEINVFASQCPQGGGIIHLGATSMDIKDNAEVLQMRQALDLNLKKLKGLLSVLAKRIETYAGVVVMAFTHLQPAEPTTLGYRLANFAQDLLLDYESLSIIRSELKGKGFKGAVGNAASYTMLFGGLEEQHRFETLMSRALELPFFEVATQTSTRKQDYIVLSALAGLAGSAYKFAFDLRLLQSEVIGEVGEPFSEGQVGSSAMPFKRNPIEAEKIDSLARAVSVAPLTAWNNYAHSLLERTLDDSANRRTLFPETFLAVDEILMTLTKIINGLRINKTNIQRNMHTFGPFAAIERVLMAAVKKGADRQVIHEELRVLSMAAWQAIQEGRTNPLFDLVKEAEQVSRWVTPDEITQLFKIEEFTGIAETRSREMAHQIRERIH